MGTVDLVAKHYRWSVLAILLFPFAAVRAADLPDPRLTPGALNPAVTQATIHQSICRKGWSKTIRPPAYVTNRLKKQQLRQYGYADPNPKHYEEDHLVPLALGGAPTDPRNLWPQPRRSEWNADKKDTLELILHERVCNGSFPLAEAQRAFMGNWIEAYQQHVHVSHQGGRHRRGRQ